jgi:flagellar biosynthesis/type III secretory pathway protein FliH
MSDMLTLKLAKPIDSIKVTESQAMAVEPGTSPADLQGDIEGEAQDELEIQKQRYEQAMQVIEAAAEKLHRVYEKMIVEHRQAIAKLAVEIARKILAQKVKDGDYQIESIIQEALNNSPTRQNVVVRLNPQDLARCQQMQQGDGAFASVKLVADPDIGPAQCVIDTPKGKVESLIDEHLEQVARALAKAVQAKL